MKNLKGLKKFNSDLEKLIASAELIREALDEKREWWDDKDEANERFAGSESGEAWADFLDDVENLLEDVHNIEPLDLENY